MKKYKMILSDNTVFYVGINGNNFISETEITENDFLGKLSTVKIEDLEESDLIQNTMYNCELVQIVKYEDGYYFVLREQTESEIKSKKIMSDIEYIAMMTDVDLEV